MIHIPIPKFGSPEYREKMRRIALERGYGKWMRGRKQPPEVTKKISAANTGQERFKIAGEFPPYSTLHKWLVAKFGRANKCEADSCLKLSTRFEYALIHGKPYKRDRDHFFMLCVRCHRNYDKQKVERFTQKSVNAAVRRVARSRGTFGTKAV